MKNPSRRNFIKAILATGATIPCSLLIKNTANAKLLTYNPAAYTIKQNACPRNCYDTCSVDTYVRDGIIDYLEGSKKSSFTNGNLCVKGYTYTRRIYSPNRIKYPMIQDGRGTGKWRRISWEEAMDIIAKKILEIKQKDGSLMGLALTKYSGNFGITNYSIEGMMSSLGYTSRFVGTPCWPAGIDAQSYDFGDMWCNDPEDIVKAKYIILWGANPAWCSMHTMKFVYEAQNRGAKVVVIDPILTQTAAKADLFLQIKAGTDGALALALSKYLVDNNLVDTDFITNNALGYEDFKNYLDKNISLEWAEQICGINKSEIVALANEFASVKPATVWIGYGMQRHTNGGAMVRAIDAFVALSGNVGKEGGGARYGQMRTWGFNYYGMSFPAPEGSIGYTRTTEPKDEFDFGTTSANKYFDRPLNINKTAREILDTNDPPVRMLWVSCKNPLSQDFDRNLMLKAFEKLELVVTVDQFFTQTVEQSDIVLPVTTLFEEWSVNVSYWHYWLSINEQIIEPLYEAKSNIEIAALLSKTINKLEPNSCTFPEDATTKDFMMKEFNQEIYDYFGINSWEDLLKGPVKAKLANSASWYDFNFMTPSKKYEFKSDLCMEHGFNALPIYVEGKKATAPYRLLTPHVQFGIHSQFINLDWTENFYPEPFVYIHPNLAEQKNIKNNDLIKVFNNIGEVIVKAQISTNVQEDNIVMYEAWFNKLPFNVQNVVDDTSSDMGAWKTGVPGVAIHDQFVDIVLVKLGQA